MLKPIKFYYKYYICYIEDGKVFNERVTAGMETEVMLALYLSYGNLFIIYITRH